MRHLSPVVAGLLLFLAAMPSPLVGQESTPIYIEDSPDADDLVKQAQVLRDQKRLTETAAMYQKVAEQYPRKLMKVEGAVFVDGNRWVRLTVAADAELLAAYRALHEPAAARALAEACKPAPKLAELEEAAQRFALCESGLEAALRAASLHLERGKSIDAANLLDDFANHPDVVKVRSRWLALQAFAALYNRENSVAIEHVKALRAAKEVESVKEIEAVAAQLKPPGAQAAYSPLSVQPAATVPEPLGKPLYIRETQSEADAPRGPSTDPTRRGIRDSDHHMMPTVAGDTVYLNTGLTLRAVDRSSLSDVWTTPFTPAVVDGTAYDRFSPMVREGALSDQRGVMIDGDHAVALMGRVTSTARGLMSSSPDTLLVSVSRADGKPAWRKTPEQIDATLTPAFFYGIPVGGDGRTYVMVRRTQNSGFRDAFLLALDSRTGALLWKRHISSTTLGYSSRGFTHILADRGTLYIADNLGAVACIDGRSGGLKWFHKLTRLKANAGGAGGSAAAWNVSPPALIKAGLVVPPFTAGTTAMLFDPRTGKKLRDLEADVFSMAAYLQEVNGDLLSVGGKVTLLDGQTLERKWQHDFGGGVAPAARAAVTLDRVLVPTGDKLITLSLADGKKIGESALDSPGNILALDGQVLITSGTTVRSYMTWPVVYENLIARMRKEPTDAQPGIALAHAALASSRPREALEGIDHVVAVLRHRAITRPQDERPETDDVHAEVFQQLLRLGDAGVTTDVKLRGEVFDRIAKATVTPRDEVQYHLAFAGYLMETPWPAELQLDRRRDAARHFQTVLESPVLSGQLVPRGGGWQQAGIEARMKLAGMIERFTRTVYEEFDDRAAGELERLLIGGNPDPAALVEVTRKYPLAKSTGAALLAAGDALAKTGKHLDAITQLRRAYREKSGASLRPRIIGELVEQYVRIGKPLRARQWLQRAERDAIDPVRAGKPVIARNWLAEIGTQPLGTAALPDIRSQLGKPEMLAGSLLLPKAQPREFWPLDRVMLATDQTVQLRGGPAFERIWDAKVEPGAELMWLNDTAAIFWVEGASKIIALDARNGKRLWAEVNANELLSEMMKAGRDDQPGMRNPRVRSQPPRVEQIGPGGRVVLRGGVIVDLNNNAPLLFPGQGAPPGIQKLTLQGQPVQADPWFADRAVRLIINDAVICIVDGGGRVVGIDLDNGQVKWRFTCPFDRVDQLAINGECVALAGGMQIANNLDAEVALIVALDALTGDLITQIEPAGNVAWLGLGEGDALLYIHQPIDRTDKPKLVVHQLPDGEQQWQTDLTTGRIDAAVMAGDAVAILVDGSDLLIAEPLGRKVRDPLGSVLVDRLEGVDVAVAGEQWHVLTPQQATAIRGEAKMMWRDGIDEEAGNRVLQLLGRERMLVVTFSGDDEALMQRFPPPQRLPDPRIQDDFTVSYRLMLLDRRGGSIVQEYRLPLTAARLDAQQAVLLNHRVLLGVGKQTMVIPDVAGK